MRGKGGKRVAEVLHGHIGECIDFDRRGKCCHNGRAEAVDKPLHHQNAEVHYRLLHTGQNGIVGDFAKRPPPKPEFFFCAQFRATQNGINHNADAGDILRKNGRLRRAADAARKAYHKPQVKPDIQNGGHRQEPKRHNRIADRAQVRCEKVIKERRGNAAENDF